MCKSPKNNEIEIKHKHRREERRKMMDDMQLKHDKILALLDGWNGGDYSDVKKKEMMGMPKNVWIDLNPDVMIRRLDDFSDMLAFDTIMNRGGEFGLHTHSDCVEICEVVSGEIHDLISNKVYKSGEVMTIQKGVEHMLIALKKTILKVYFK